MKKFSIPSPTLGKDHFVRFAGATGDFNPVHFDADFARDFGLPHVISQGPLTFMLALDAAAQEVGLDNIQGFKARVTSPVFPETEMTITGDEEGTVTATQGETVYLTGKLVGK